ncbi:MULTISPECIES: DUF6455 family protein [unclassified Ruegeria]|uniref:DUF6455 family protein n=1 Tax=unclassified Ruegeria TaxID=2625375 RepID=UPI001489E15B|nr:DUF6455 family protein [Ruegeria sp. HKCCD8929]
MPQIPLGEIERHFWLTRSVARCMDVSLTEAMAEGRLTEHDYAQLITRCRAAQCHGQCEHWLAAQQARADTAPAFCANAEALNRLK